VYAKFHCGHHVGWVHVPTFRDDKPIFRDGLSDVIGDSRVDLESLKVAIVDSDHPRFELQRAIELVPGRDRPGVLAGLARQPKRIAPRGYRRFGRGPAWVRVTGADGRRRSMKLRSWAMPTPRSRR